MSGPSTKVRLVRCPKCRAILPEMPNLQIYKCGGCGVTLRAKKRKEESGSSQVPVPNAVHNNQNGTLETPEENPAQNLNKSGSMREPHSDSIPSSSGPPQNHPGRCLETHDTDTVQKYTDPAQRNQVESLEPPDTYLAKRNHLGHAFAAKELDSSSEEPLDPPQDIAHHYSDHASSRDAVETTDAIITSENDKLNNSPKDASNENNQSEIKSSSSNYQLQQSQKTLHQKSDQAVGTEERIMPEKDAISSGPRRFFNDNVISEAASSSSKEQLDNARPGDPEDTTEAIDDSVMSEEDKLFARLRDVSKSPTNRSSYAYDGSISSSEGLDDPYFDQHSHPFRRPSFESQNVSDFADANDYSVNNKTDTDTDRDVQHQARRISLLSLNGKQGPVEEQNQVKVDNVQGFRPVRRWMGLERDSGNSFYQRGSYPLHKDGEPSNFRKREYCLHARDKMEYAESSQMELLKKVNELRDHLNKSYALRGNGNGQFTTTGSQQADPWHEYYKEPSIHDALRRFDAKYAGQPSTAYRPSKSAPYEYGDLRTSFSGEVSHCNHHAGYSCCLGHPERRQCSQQLPPPNTYHNRSGGIIGVHAVHMCNAPYMSSHSGPQQHPVDSTFHIQGYYSEPTSYDHGHTEHKMKLHHRKRLNTIKRHYKPIAGGAPFVVCYRCLKLLHLPADFLPSKKRCHKLRCGSCSKVLLFSLGNNSAVLPLSRNPTVPPPSEVGNSSDTATRRRLASEFHADDSSPGGDVSYSRDYGFSVPNSGSTVDESTPASRNHNGHQTRVDKTQPSSSYVEPMEEVTDRSAMPQHFREERDIIIQAKMERSSSGRKVTLRSNSPLHRLMGYSSASEVIQGPPASRS